MSDSTDSIDRARREYIKALGAAGLVGTGSLAGCSGGGDGGDGSGDGGGDGSSGDGRTTTSGGDGGNAGDLIGVPMKSLGAFFFRTAATAAQYEAEQLGYQTNLVGAGGDSEKLNRQISDMASRDNTAAIITDPVDSEAQQAPITSAMDDGIPIGVVDTPASSEATVTVAFDNYLAGENLANRCAKVLEEKHGSLDGTKVVYFHGFLGSYAWNERMKGTRDRMEEIAADSGLTFDNVEGGGSPEEFATSATEWLSQNSDVDAILNASSGGFLAGILQTLNREDLLYYRGHDEHILVGAVDGYLSDVKWMEEGYIDFISMQNPVAYGQICVDLLDEFAIGQDTRDVIPVGEAPDVVQPDRFYYGTELGKDPAIEEKEWGPHYTVPTYMMDPSNVSHDMHWPKLAENRLGMESEAADLDLDPQGTPPSN
jgi:ABC-type sugar transport system substrate-binding protein